MWKIVYPNNAINHRTLRNRLSHKRQTISFYDFLCALFYAKLNLFVEALAKVLTTEVTEKTKTIDKRSLVYGLWSMVSVV